MGAIISVECSCGYMTSNHFDSTGRLVAAGYHEMGELLLGNGMYTHHVYYYPALCNRCQEVVPINLEHSNTRCPVCSDTSARPYYDPQLVKGNGTNEIAYSTVCLEDEHGKKVKYTMFEDVKYLCPKCSSYGLKFKQKGLWD